MKISVADLTEAQETMLMPLWARALEVDRENPIVNDPHARRLVDSMEYNFDKLARHERRFAGFCIRSAVFDRLADEYLGAHPQSTVVELGAGLDTRFERLDNGQIRWFDLDLPAVAALRHRFFQDHSRRTLIAGSLLEDEWLDRLRDTQIERPLFIAEGVLYFLSKPQVFQLFTRMAERFPGCQIIFDAQSPWFLKYSNWRHPLADSKLQWSIGSLSELARQRGIELIKYVGFGDRPYYPSHSIARLPLHERLAQRYLPGSRHLFKVLHLALGKTP